MAGLLALFGTEAAGTAAATAAEAASPSLAGSLASGVASSAPGVGAAQSALAGSGAGMSLANVLKGINELEQQPAVQLFQKAKPLFTASQAPQLPSMQSNNPQIVSRRRPNRMF